jgi:hypothetical protein
MEQTSLKQLVKSGVVRNISVLRENINEYPYVTLLNKKGESQNIYFGQKSAVLIKDTFETGDNILVALKEASVMKTSNADGEVRYKLSLPAPGAKYSSDVELMDVFGIEEVENEFNVEQFQKQFQAQVVEQPA